MGIEPTRQLVTGTLVLKTKKGTKAAFPQTLDKSHNAANVMGLRVFHESCGFMRFHLLSWQKSPNLAPIIILCGVYSERQKAFFFWKGGGQPEA